MKLSEFLAQYKNDESIIYFCDDRLQNFFYYYFQDKINREIIRSNAQEFLNENGVIFALQEFAAFLGLLESADNSLFLCEPALRRQTRILFLEWAISKGAQNIEDLFKPLTN